MIQRMKLVLRGNLKSQFSTETKNEMDKKKKLIYSSILL